jgi:hypothetical protein
MVYNFQIGNNEVKLPTEYGSVTKTVLLATESTLWDILSYSESSTILFFPVWKLQAKETRTII